MPIRFHCSNCQQRLSVAARKVGQEVKCPACRRVVRVPDDESVASASGHHPPPVPPIESFPQVGPADELVYAETLSHSADRSMSVERISLPRYVLFLQGFLLGAVALVFFVFGLAVGSRSLTESADTSFGVACTVSGSILFEDTTNSIRPDEGSVVILLPVARRPDEKAPATDLAPNESELPDDHPTLTMLRTLGGDYALVDRRGHYQVRATGTGRYYLLVISRHGKRAASEQPLGKDLAQLGRYVIPATDLLGQHRYRWQEILLRGDRQHNVTF